MEGNILSLIRSENVSMIINELLDPLTVGVNVQIFP